MTSEIQKIAAHTLYDRTTNEVIGVGIAGGTALFNNFPRPLASPERACLAAVILGEPNKKITERLGCTRYALTHRLRRSLTRAGVVPPSRVHMLLAANCVKAGILAFTEFGPRENFPLEPNERAALASLIGDDRLSARNQDIIKSIRQIYNASNEEVTAAAMFTGQLGHTAIDAAAVIRGYGPDATYQVAAV